jgi:hypothetical protein
VTDTIACARPGCEATSPRPAPCQWAPLWAQGWRWIGSLALFSCPACPPVVLDENGRHRLGPGAQ